MRTFKGIKNFNPIIRPIFSNVYPMSSGVLVMEHRSGTGFRDITYIISKILRRRTPDLPGAPEFQRSDIAKFALTPLTMSH